MTHTHDAHECVRSGQALPALVWAGVGGGRKARARLLEGFFRAGRAGAAAPPLARPSLDRAQGASWAGPSRRATGLPRARGGSGSGGPDPARCLRDSDPWSVPRWIRGARSGPIRALEGRVAGEADAANPGFSREADG